MSAPGPPFPIPPAPITRHAVGSWLLDLLKTALAVTLGFVAVGLVAAVVWQHVVVLPTETKQGTGAGMGEEQLRQIFFSDGWFMLITAIVGLVLGVLVEVWRRGHPVARVLAVAVAGVLAAWAMARLGLVLGPPDPASVLPSAADGTDVPLRLVVASRSAYLVWPFASVLGVLLVLLLRPRHDEYVFDGPFLGVGPTQGDGPAAPLGDGETS